MKILWTKPAQQDLHHIEAYLETENPRAAVQMVLKVMDSVEMILPSYPNAGRAGQLPGTRELVIVETPYMVVYRCRVGALEVLRVLHHAQEWL
ncbi:MAG: type II toxin-antitoxin system RelE/ParE family toxin [Vampirovibrionales bacterium]|nr:type II toxin-antitoxin system RelE/ParE family toxin [Vampirovibrionales bacterium]